MKLIGADLYYKILDTELVEAGYSEFTLDSLTEYLSKVVTGGVVEDVRIEPPFIIATYRVKC